VNSAIRTRFQAVSGMQVMKRSYEISSAITTRSQQHQCPDQKPLRNLSVNVNSSGMLLAMTRPLLLEFANALYHVTSRGDRRGKIYRDDANRLAWQEVLALVCERHHFVVHSFCPRSQRRDSTLSLAQYQARYCNRDKAMARAYLSTACSMPDIAVAFHV